MSENTCQYLSCGKLSQRFKNLLKTFRFPKDNKLEILTTNSDIIFIFLRTLIFRYNFVAAHFVEHRNTRII